MKPPNGISLPQSTRLDQPWIVGAPISKGNSLQNINNGPKRILRQMAQALSERSEGTL